MPLTPDQAVEAATALLKTRGSERLVLDEVRRYWTGAQRLPPIIPDKSPRIVREMARMARVNIIDLVIESFAQSLFVDGFRADTDTDNHDVWAIWQANKMDARQSGIHRAALAYGTAYAIVLPGAPEPVIRGVSPRMLTAEYDDDDDDEWPVRALEWRPFSKTFRLYDETSVYTLGGADKTLSFVKSLDHDVGYVPIVRYREEDDLDTADDVLDWSLRSLTRYVTTKPLPGQVWPLMAIQDQIDGITFNLLVAQHFAAFRQRYVIGWTTEDENEKAQAAASQLWTFEDPTVKVGDLAETALGGYIDSRKESMRHAASLSQTPSHELIGELVNLSADAIAAAEAGRDRKVIDRQTMFGEAHEQTLRLAGQLGGIDVPDDAQTRWRDTSARSLSALVDALGKAATMLGIPPDELWERMPGVTQQDVERWRARKLKEKADALAAIPPANERVTIREDATPNAPTPTGGGQPPSLTVVRPPA